MRKRRNKRHELSNGKNKKNGGRKDNGIDEFWTGNKNTTGKCGIKVKKLYPCKVG